MFPNHNHTGEAMVHVSVHLASSVDPKTRTALLALISTYFDEVSKEDGRPGKTEVKQTTLGPGDILARKVSIRILTDNRNWVMRRHGQSFISRITTELPSLKGEISMWIEEADHTFG